MRCHNVGDKKCKETLFYFKLSELDYNASRRQGQWSDCINGDRRFQYLHLSAKVLPFQVELFVEIKIICRIRSILKFYESEIHSSVI